MHITQLFTQENAEALHGKEDSKFICQDNAKGIYMEKDDSKVTHHYTMSASLIVIFVSTRQQLKKKS